MPIPVEKLQDLKHIVVHDKCGDGTASAMILKLCFPYADVEFVQYDNEKHRTLPVRPDTIFADFSPHAEQVKEFIQAEAVVLDHHKTQRQIVAEFGELGVFGDEATEPGVSGAVLAYREVWVPMMQGSGSPYRPLMGPLIEDFALLAGIRDTWQNKHPRWIEANEMNSALTFWPSESLLGLDPREWRAKLELGPLLYKRRMDWAKKCGDGAWRFTTAKGTKVAVFQGLKAASDAAEYLDLAGDDTDLVFAFDVFLVDGEPAMVCTTRSHTDFDCGSFAKTFPGGGGHTRAAGFKVRLQPDDPNPFYLAKRLVESHEQS
jgi:hypothetical protein